jgi:transcription-repair coupling factor (superfamily II helicase)
MRRASASASSTWADRRAPAVRAKPDVDPMTVIQMIQKQPQHYAMEGPDKLRLKLDLPDAGARVQAAKGLLTALQRAA